MRIKIVRPHLAKIGTIEVGKRADLVRWRVADPAELAYRIGDSPSAAVMFGGRTEDHR